MADRIQLVSVLAAGIVLLIVLEWSAVAGC